MDFNYLINSYNKLSRIFLVSVGLVTFGIAEYYIDIKPPNFREQLTDSVTNNEALMNKIGGWNQSQFQYSDSTENDNTFKIIINGKCDSALIVIKGKYKDKRYIVTDTIVRACR